MSKKKAICRKCKKIIIEDWEAWLKENQHQAYVQCPYCWHLEKIK
jgi:DNA-directed RNA polymerase subunit RPC12/RpoP